MRTLALLTAGAWSTLAACSLQTTSYEPCTTNAECRDTFGLGTVCGAEGLCQELELLDRCTTFPDDLLTSADLSDAFVFGSVFDDLELPWMAKATRLAVLQVNDHDGLDGHPFGLVACNNAPGIGVDERDHNEATEAIVEHLTGQLGLPVVVGPATSTRTEIAYNTASPYGSVIISPSATSPSLTPLDGLGPNDENPGLLWRTAFPDDLQGKVLAQTVDELDLNSVAVIYETGSYGEGLANVFQTYHEALGGSVELLPFSADSDIGGITVEAYPEGSPHSGVLFISAEVSRVTAFLQAAATIDRYDDDGVAIFLADGAYDGKMLDDTEEAAFHLYDQILGTRPSVPSGTIFDSFAAAYAAEYDGEDVTNFAYTAHTYDAAWLSIYGLTWAWYSSGALTGIDIARGLRQLSDGEPIAVRPTTWNALKANFRAGMSVDVRGTSGELDFDPATEETTGPIDRWRIVEDGQGGWDFEIIDCVEPGGGTCGG